jgi:hypothetical protein
MLQSLYQKLADLYELEAPHNIDDFLITDRTLAAPLQTITMQKAREQLFVRESYRQLDVTLYLDQSVLANLKSENPVSGLNLSEINDYWLAIEGISHFLYLTWRGSYDRPMTQLEMELQAEIDKYLCSCLSLAGLALPLASPSLSNNLREQWLKQLHHILFEQTTIVAGQNTDRYATANRYAARYCQALRPQLQQGMSLTLINELRRFYRLSQSEKLRRIDALH